MTSPAGSGTWGTSTPRPAGRRTLALLPQRCAPVGPPPGQEQRPGRALSRNRAENSEVCGSDPTTSSSMSSGSIISSSIGSSSADSGRRRTMPSSPHMLSTGMSKRSISRRSMAIAHGACTGVPNGERMHTRQSPISSRNRSTTTVRSSGTTPVACACSSRYSGASVRGERVERVVLGEPCQRVARRHAPHLTLERTERSPELQRAPRPVAVPERHLPRLARRRRDRDPLEGDVLDAPRARPEQERLAGAALVDHLLVELADPQPSGRNTPNGPRSGMVPPLVTASRFEPSRARSVPATRSHTTHGPTWRRPSPAGRARSSPATAAGTRPTTMSLAAPSPMCRSHRAAPCRETSGTAPRSAGPGPAPSAVGRVVPVCTAPRRSSLRGFPVANGARRTAASTAGRGPTPSGRPDAG